MSHAPRPAVLCFADFRIEPSRHALTRGGEAVKLSPHLVDILHHLAARPGTLVTKEELLERFWPGVHVTENTLTRAIADIRKALGDEAAHPRYIQTVARHGFRFVAESAAPADLDAFAALGRGRRALESLDGRQLPHAVQAFEQAIDAMPQHAPAYAGLANACFLQHETTRARNQPDRAPLRRAVEAARRACTLDPSLGEAWATLGFAAAAAGGGATDDARAALRRAVTLEPSNWRHHFRFALVSWGEERLRACDRALALFPAFAPARFAAAMVFIARQAFVPAMDAATAGADAQSQQGALAGLSFPAAGLHWLRGVLLLHQRQTGHAVQAFVREMEEGHPGRIYADEFRVNALVGAGFAHLATGDPAVAIEAFRNALAIVPRHGRALIGLQQAFAASSFAASSESLWREVEHAVVELREGQRLIEAALVMAAAHAARGNLASGCAILEQMLHSAPPGQAGWLIPVDPALEPLRAAPEFARVAALLASRAA